MATISKNFFRGSATTTTSTVLYTVPSATTAVVTNILIVNTSGTSKTFTMSLSGVKIAETVTVAGFDSAVLDMKQVMSATQTITGGASGAEVSFHISGIEVS